MMDEKGRPSPDEMTDSQKLDEILLTLRVLIDMIQIIGQSPYGMVMANTMGIKLPNG